MSRFCRGWWPLCFLVLLLFGLAAIGFGILRTDRRIVGAWREAPPQSEFGVIPGRNRVFVFRPGGTMTDTEYFANGETVGSSTWKWWSRRGDLTLRVIESPPSGNWVVDGLTTAFDEAYRLLASVPQNEETSYRIIEITPTQLRLQSGTKDKPREVVFERVR